MPDHPDPDALPTAPLPSVILREAARAVELLDEPDAYPRQRPVIPAPYDSLAVPANAIAVDGPLAGQVHRAPPGLRPGQIHQLRNDVHSLVYDYALETETTPSGLDFQVWSYVGVALPGAARRPSYADPAPPQPFTGALLPHAVTADGLEIICCTCPDRYGPVDADGPQGYAELDDWAVAHFTATDHRDFLRRTLDRYTFDPRPLHVRAPLTPDGSG